METSSAGTAVMMANAQEGSTTDTSVSNKPKVLKPSASIEELTERIEKGEEEEEQQQL